MRNRLSRGTRNHTIKTGFLPEAAFYLLVFAAITCFALVQAYGDPPDEINRFKVVDFICRHGKLPHGADPEVLLDGFGASYAFQPMLTYIIQGFLLRALKLFTSDRYVLLVAARMVNVVFGVLMAYFVRQIAKEVWKSPYLQWVFTVMAVFLPQNIFIHSYVNTDSMAMLSVSVIFYALLRAQRTDYEKKDCILLAVGIILCAMSYYNAYGIILAAILIFGLRYVHLGKRPEPEAAPNALSLHKEKNASPIGENTGTGTAQDSGTAKGNKADSGAKAVTAAPGKKTLWIEWGPLLRKGLFISAIVLAGIGWWFIRNAILYDGDIIAMNARRECAIQTATPDFNPLTRFTYQNSGKSLYEMLAETQYAVLVFNSFIAMFGAMDIYTHGIIYLCYRWFWLVSCLVSLFVPGRLWEQAGDDLYGNREPGPFGSGRKKRLLFHGGMVLFCLITVALSLIYSYTWDFQPQGRYILPILIPLMYLITLGVQKLCGMLQKSARWLAGRLGGGQMRAGAVLAKAAPVLGKLLCIGIIVWVLSAFAYSLFCSFLPYYSQHENLFSLYGQVM